MKKVLLGCGLVVVVVAVLLVMAVMGSYNRLVTLEEAVKTAWSQVENVYQRRADLVPNLVETVKGAAAFEKDTFTAVTEARAKVGQIDTGKAPNRGGDAAVPGRTGRALLGALAASGRGREVP